MKKQYGNKYEQVPVFTIDLHGMRMREVQLLLPEVLQEYSGKHIRIITGKGNHNNGVSPIRGFVVSELLKMNIPFRPAKLHDGGAGAIEVQL